MSTDLPGRPFLFVGERLCIDFANTEIVDGGQRRDLLGDVHRLIEWCAAAGIVSPSEARDIARRFERERDARAALAQAVRLRAAVRSILERLANGQGAVSRDALDVVNGVLSHGTGAREIVRTTAGYETRVRRAFTEPAQLLVPIADSIADLLKDDDLALVKKCQNPQCILFFYDTTKNHARRWCSMAACGNRAKVAAHYRRARVAAAGTDEEPRTGR